MANAATKIREAANDIEDHVDEIRGLVASLTDLNPDNAVRYAAAFHDFARAQGLATGDLDVPFRLAPSAYRADLIAALEKA